MQEKLFCANCKKQITEPNIRLKGNQHYCGEKKCQDARKARWKREKMATDLVFAAEQNQYVAQWRKNKPADQYQKNYRENHPEYTEDNRRKQGLRNQKRKSLPPEPQIEKIVKVDALPPSDQKTNIYRVKILTPGIVTCSGSDRTDLLIILKLNPINTYFRLLEARFCPQKVCCKKRMVNQVKSIC